MPDPRLPSQPQSYQIILLGYTEAHVIEQLFPGWHRRATSTPRIEVAQSVTEVARSLEKVVWSLTEVARRSNHSHTMVVTTALRTVP